MEKEYMNDYLALDDRIGRKEGGINEGGAILNSVSSRN